MQLTKVPLGLRRFAIVFDVNRTILIEDKAAGKTRADELKAIITQQSFGTITKNLKGEESFKLTSSPSSILSSQPPEPNELSYFNFLQKILPFPVLPESMPNSQKMTLIESVKKKRRDLQKIFLDDHQPGQSLKPLFDHLLASSESPPGFSLLSSFYEAVNYFSTQNRKISFSFRTFGEDLLPLSTEWNSFCSGSHPDFNSINFNHLKLTNENLGCIYRNGPRSEDCHLVMGTVELPPNVNYGIDFYGSHNNVKIYSGFNEIDNFFQEQYSKGSVLGIRDCYHWWASQSETFGSGKLFFLSDEHFNSNSERVRQIFFDDNLHIDEFRSKRKLIVDVRDVGTGDSIGDVEGLFGRFCVKVEPLKAIMNRRYFIEEIEKLCKE